MKEQDEGLYYVRDFPVPETPELGREPKQWQQTRVVGKAMPRVDAYERLSGSAVYPSDVTFPDMLYGVVVGSPHANARVRGVDVATALKMPGVHAAATGSTKGADLNWPYVWGTSMAKLFDPHCRYEGDAVAGICAETPYQAWDAAKAIKIDYEVLPCISDERTALDLKAPAVDSPDKRTGKTDKYERGDVEKGFAEADAVLETDYRTECVIHTPIESHGCVAKWVVSRNWHDYKLPTALDVPREIVTVLVDPDDTEANTTGAKGLAEPATIPTAAAIANAVYNAIGIRITDTPMGPVQLSNLLAKRKARG